MNNIGRNGDAYYCDLILSHGVHVWNHCSAPHKTIQYYIIIKTKILPNKIKNIALKTLYLFPMPGCYSKSHPSSFNLYYLQG